MDCTASDSMCKREYQQNHVEYECTNEEQHQLRGVLIKELTATGIVKVLADFEVDNALRRASLDCISRL
jgi:hypothetical protein